MPFEVKDFTVQQAFSRARRRGKWAIEPTHSLPVLRYSLCHPPEALDLVSWSEKYFVLSREYASEPGKFRISRTPWLRRPMLNYRDPKISKQVLCLANQLGKSLYLMAIFGKTAHFRPFRSSWDFRQKK